MKKMIFAAAIVAAAAGTASATDLIAYWNFNDSIPGVSGNLGVLNPAGFNADAGAGVVTTNFSINTDVNNVNGDLGTFSGSTINALFGDPSGGALSVRGEANNGNWIQFEFDASLYTDVSISWAGRGTGTGFGSPDAPNTIQWSTDGVNFTSFATYQSRQTSFQLYDFAVGNSLDLASNAIIRIVFDGATSTAGNNRLDNVQIVGTLIPTPGAAGLLGLAGLAAIRRRR